MDDAKYSQVVEFARFSETTWQLAPPARADLIKSLGDNTSDLEFYIELKFKRAEPVNVRQGDSGSRFASVIFISSLLPP